MEWLDDPAFTGLVHRWLRWVRVIVATNAAPLPVDYYMPRSCGRCTFHGYQQLIVYSVQHLVPEE
jgi:hypothetical protein